MAGRLVVRRERVADGWECATPPGWEVFAVAPDGRELWIDATCARSDAVERAGVLRARAARDPVAWAAYLAHIVACRAEGRSARDAERRARVHRDRCAGVDNYRAHGVYSGPYPPPSV